MLFEWLQVITFPAVAGAVAGGLSMLFLMDFARDLAKWLSVPPAVAPPPSKGWLVRQVLNPATKFVYKFWTAS